MKINDMNENIEIKYMPKLKNPKMVIGFDGWMDGGDVSTGTIKFLNNQFNARPFAEVKEGNFFIQNFPGNMEISALFRPEVEIIEGVVENLSRIKNTFYASENHELIFFLGKEPNLNWNKFIDTIFSVCNKLNVNEIYFPGSVAGLTPHTREPRIFCTVSDPKYKKEVGKLGLTLTDYDGPASIINTMLLKARQQDIKMVTLIAEVPAYVQGYNPKCIATAAKCIGKFLQTHVEIKDLRKVGDKFEKKLNKLIEDQPELAENIKKLEEDYDNNVFDTRMSDLKDWLESKGIEVD